MKYNIHDFLSKIDYEGGVYGALDYGLTVAEYDLPQNIVDKWKEIGELFTDLEELVRDFDILADKAAEATPFEEVD
jgi:hypothetical protein